MTKAFIVIGAMKSGTSTLESILRGLDGVQLIAEKESSPWLTESMGVTTAVQISVSGAQAAGDVSTAYMQRPLYEVDTERVASILGCDTQIFAVLREPLGRAVSHWRHWEQLGKNQHPSLSAALRDPDSYHVAFSRYAHQLQPWVDAFGFDRVHPLRLEDYIEDPRCWVQGVCKVLNVEEPAVVSKIHANSGDTRVVAGGPGSLLMEHWAYRRLVRRMVPPAIRKIGTLALGGRRGGHRPPQVDIKSEMAFRQNIAEDSARLLSTWPHLKW